MYGFANILKQQKELGVEAQESVQFIVNGTRQLIQLVNELLHSTVASKYDDHLAFVDSGEVVQQVLAGLKSLTDSRKVMVDVGILPTVWADATQLRRVFQNLIENAIKSSSPDRPAVIEVKAHDAGRETIFSVSDNGRGIEEQKLGQIFELYERVNPEQHIAGKGIGLATCRKIVEQFGGRVWVQSKPHEGSEFFFSIPHHEASSQAEVQETSEIL